MKDAISWHVKFGRPLIHPDVWFDLKWCAFLIFGATVSFVCIGLGYVVATMTFAQ